AAAAPEQPGGHASSELLPSTGPVPSRTLTAGRTRTAYEAGPQSRGERSVRHVAVEWSYADNTRAEVWNGSIWEVQTMPNPQNFAMTWVSICCTLTRREH